MGRQIREQNNINMDVFTETVLQEPVLNECGLVCCSKINIQLKVKLRASIRINFTTQKINK